MITIQINLDDTLLQHVTTVLATQNLSITEAVQQWLVLIATKERLPLEMQVPILEGKQRVFGSAKGLIKMADDFDVPLSDFKEYM